MAKAGPSTASYASLPGNKTTDRYNHARMYTLPAATIAEAAIRTSFNRFICNPRNSGSGRLPWSRVSLANDHCLHDEGVEPGHEGHHHRRQPDVPGFDLHEKMSGIEGFL